MSDVPHAIFSADSVVLPQGGPLYLQLKRWIEEAVASGAIRPGDALPSERDLALKVDVSRVTVRKAVQHLVRDGILVQKHGSGTFVAPQPHRVEQSLSQLTSFAEDMARRGMAVRSVWLDRGIYHPSPEEMRESQDPSQGLNQFIPPFWTQQYEWDGLDRDAYQAWEQRLMPRFPHDAERRSLQDLIPAWRSGIDTIIVLPYSGYFAHRLSCQRLVVSAETRNQPDDYSRALRECTG